MEHYVWMDMEMTGLNPQRDQILEIATIITDTDLNVVKQLNTITIGHDVDNLSFNFAEGTEKKFIEYFHDSDLLDRVQNSTTTIEEAEKYLLENISENCEAQQCCLAGNSIWCDAAFLREFFPSVEKYLHYRLLDVSTIKMLKRAWYPELPELEKEETHDALNDILVSIEELKYYREHIFK
mgnify:CR=1 FL=1